MNLTRAGFLACFLLLGTLPVISATPASHWQRFQQDIRPLFEEYCISCHDADRRSGDVDLDGIKQELDLYRNIRLWRKLSNQVRYHEMPPRDRRKQPKDTARDQVIQWISDFLASPDFSILPDEPLRNTPRRLSQAEIGNTLVDLLHLDYNPAALLPADGSGGAGFSNNADTLFLPPLWVERLANVLVQALDRAFQHETSRRILVPEHRDTAQWSPSAKNRLDSFMARAHRTRPSPHDIQQTHALFDHLSQSLEPEEALKQTYLRILLSPRFVFRVEDSSDQQTRDLSPHELATRLSYFLWSTMPDEELFMLADAGLLLQPDVLRDQLQRMLAHPNARRLASEFGRQWLGITALETEREPDPTLFPEFNPELRDAMIEEVVMFTHYIFSSNRPLLEMIDAPYTFVNRHLAKHYGLEQFRDRDHLTREDTRFVALTNRQRGGVLGMAAVLTSTSYPTRTSPVLRGQWILEHLLGDPAPPPPPNVGALPESTASTQPMTLRQKIEVHRRLPECSACHRRMDPPGFGLEHFDAIGRWRDMNEGAPVESEGQLLDGSCFEGPIQLKDILLAQSPLFLSHFTDQLFSYALGREIRFTDEPALRHITSTLNTSGPFAHVLIEAIIFSNPFLTKGP